MTKWLKWAGWPLGIAIFIALVVRDGAGDVVHVIGQAGFALLWLVPFHALPLLLDACGWRTLLRGRAPLAFLWWVATVREAVSRLLPVLAVGGEIVGIRLARWRVRDASRVSASVIVEVLVTIAVQYAFSALGVVLILAATGGDHAKTIALALVLSLPLPVITALLLRRGGVFRAIERFAARALGSEHRFLQGIDGARLDAEIDALMTRTGVLLQAFVWQFAGYLVGALETYWALALLGHPVSAGGAIAIEALTQAVRHAAFMVPAGLGVQEAAVVLLAQMFGVDREVGLSLALVKRMREVLFGCMALGSWQLAEMVRARRHAHAPAVSSLQPAQAAGARGQRASAFDEMRDEAQDAAHNEAHHADLVR
ncbi:lysylphosphatidylglycerol synthase domain-containing protein [Trinickia acidisoli]|uniref:lysylphosphatidylglycerol synthase domain-containing protein n=1 Tax=Trinickia acidisoli TaxID=2767482 RepID=UPI001A8DC78A|nr:lysylphosphatidylglycerol synthase domain-containing protein [Trinickia acidisoli]